MSSGTGRRMEEPAVGVGFPVPTFFVLVPREVFDSLYNPSWILGATLFDFFCGREDMGMVKRTFTV